ncbi:MAG: hypothetical protein JXR51_15755 [Bacteroidales bacterium]|nr:hypothetical protein [Bacteroidales bacterium]MBN2758625.1 hypothetical protein [Bacteroidales bacterium]
MKTIVIIVISLIISIKTYSQFSENVQYIDSKADSEVFVSGDLFDGEIIDDLSWAWNSSVACFPATQKQKFTGNHVLYCTNLPSKSEMYITVEPEDKDADFSIYAYSIGKTNYSVVPNLFSCVSCEAEHKWDRPKVGKTQDHTRQIRLNAIKNPYNVVIGVVGGNGLKSGKYKLSIKLIGGKSAENLNQEKVQTIALNCEKNKITEIKGDLKNGVLINDLSWAWNSSVACFPETQKQKFTGNHVIYTTEIPTYSTMKITVIPDNKNADFSLYAYEIGVSSDKIVPDLPSCVSCEAEHKWDYPKRGKTQDHTRTVDNLTAINHPYKVVIGVVGAKGLKSGGFILQIDLKSR